MELPKMASAMSKQNFQVRPTEASMHGHRLTGQHASGMGEYGGYHHHHNPSLTRMGPPPGTAAAYPHKVVTDPLPPMGMAYPHHYNMSVTHGMYTLLCVCTCNYVILQTQLPRSVSSESLPILSLPEQSGPILKQP